MSTKEQKRKRLVFGGLAVISLLLIISLIRDVIELSGTEDRFLRAEEEIKKLEGEKGELEQELSGEGVGFLIEKEIRDELGMAKPKEIVVVLPEELIQQQIESGGESKDLEVEMANWRKWLQVFDF